MTRGKTKWFTVVMPFGLAKTPREMIAFAVKLSRRQFGSAMSLHCWRRAVLKAQFTAGCDLSVRSGYG